MSYVTRQKKIFLKELKAGKKPEEAYAIAYKTVNLSKTVIARRAAQILADRETDKQAGKVQDLWAGADTPWGEAGLNADHGHMNVGEISRMLLCAYAKAQEDGRAASAMISATLALAKLHGFMHDRQEQAGPEQDLIRKIQEARKRVRKDSEATNQGKNS